MVAKDLLYPSDGSAPHAYHAVAVLTTAAGDEKIERGGIGYIVATMVSNLEKTFTVSPASQPLDGQFRVIHFGRTSGDKAMEIMTQAYNSGAHVSMEWDGEGGVKERVGYKPIEGMRIGMEELGVHNRWRRCCIDGMIVSLEEDGFMNVKVVAKGGEAVDVVGPGRLI